MLRVISSTAFWVLVTKVALTPLFITISFLPEIKYRRNSLLGFVSVLSRITSCALVLHSRMSCSPLLSQYAVILFNMWGEHV